MACFVVPATEAVVTTIAAKVLKAKEKETAEVKEHSGAEAAEEAVTIPFSRKLSWLSNFLWGGSALLAFEHVWHGEVVPWFPFLTAAKDAAATAEMFQEMSTVGVTMAVLVTGVWGVVSYTADCIVKRKEKESAVRES